MKTTLQNGEGIKWPKGKKVAVMLSFDFDSDRLQYARLGEKAGFADLNRGQYGPNEGLDRVLRVLKQQEVKATFFIPGINIERYPKQIDSIIDGGHEIAYHGYLHDSNFEVIPIEKEIENMEKSEALIQRFWGRKPVGHRAPHGLLQTYSIDLIAQRGYKYSSASNPEKACDWAYCYERGGKKIPLVEFTTDVMTGDFAYFFFSYSEPQHKHMYLNKNVQQIWTDEYDGRWREEDKMLCLKLHPSLIGRASRARMLESYITYLKEHDAWIASCEEVADYVIKENGL